MTTSSCPVALETFEPLQAVWIKVSGRWYEARYWKTVNGKPIFTTNGITEITDCEWAPRDIEMTQTNWVKDTIIERDKGITKNAIRKKRERKIWIDGLHYKMGPDGVYYYDINAINRWIEEA